MRTYLWLFAVGMGLGLGCGDHHHHFHNDMIDAGMVDMGPMVDAMESELSFADNEGGEIRLEWIQNVQGQTTARVTAFFYKSQDPPRHDPPSFPGCVDARNKDTWPLAQGTIVPLDVGNVIIASKTGTPLTLTRDSTSGSKDFLQRPHDLWYKKTPNFTANDGDTFLPPNQRYNVLLTGSGEWPAQALQDVTFMPDRWAPESPVTNATTQLVANTDLVITYDPVVSSNLPPNTQVNMVVAFTGTGHSGPIVICQQDGLSGTLTVPAAMVNILRQYSPGAYVRQNLTHKHFELTDGSPRATANRKRVDVLSVYCYNTPWENAP